MRVENYENYFFVDFEFQTGDDLWGARYYNHCTGGDGLQLSVTRVSAGESLVW